MSHEAVPRTAYGFPIRVMGLVLCLAIMAGACWYFFIRETPPPVEPTNTDNLDPRLTYPTPYRNVHPDVQYVGDQACAACHADQCDTYKHHPMGQALFTVANATAIEQYHKETHNPFGAGGLYYAVQAVNGKMFHTEYLPAADGKNHLEQREEVHFSIGSGAKARSYAVNRDGYLFQSPITWYPEKQRWDISPSYELRNFHFNRAIAPGCLFCHCNYAEHVPGTVNKYKGNIFQGLSIGCERCHGPGQLHVNERLGGPRQGKFDDTIVNPAKLEHSLRDAVCQQCHVQGEQRILARGRADFDFRPGLPLHLFLMDFVDTRDERDDFKFVSSFDQMMASKCYKASDETKKLGCISCHDSHNHPTGADKIAHYRRSCLQCHTDQSCALPLATRKEKNKDDSCVACHMPARPSELNHAAITDHRIPRKPPTEPKVAPRRNTPGPRDLVPFHRHLLKPDDPEVARNLGLATMAMFDRGMPEAVEREYASAAVPLLEAARKRDPNDIPVLTNLADAYWSLGNTDDAATIYEHVTTQKPDLETARASAGGLALVMNRNSDAKRHYQEALRINPWRWNYQFGLATALFRMGELDTALTACQQTLKLDASNPKPRSLLIQCHLAQGQYERADAEYALLKELTTTERRASLAIWYGEQQHRFPRKRP